jgi:hypothetical protein
MKMVNAYSVVVPSTILLGEDEDSNMLKLLIAGVLVFSTFSLTTNAADAPLADTATSCDSATVDCGYRGKGRAL